MDENRIAFDSSMFRHPTQQIGRNSFIYMSYNSQVYVFGQDENSWYDEDYILKERSNIKYIPINSHSKKSMSHIF